MSNSTLRTAQLEQALAPLNRQRYIYTAGRLAGRAFEFYFVMVVVSLFVGFLEMFATQTGDMDIMFTIMRVFMLTVLGLVLFGIIRRQVKKILTERKSILSDSGFYLNIIAIVLTALAYFAGYVIGTQFLGNDMDMSFFVRWVGAIGSVFLLLGPYFLLKRAEIAFTQRYKTALISTVLPGLSPQAQYNTNGLIGRQVFTDSHLFPSEQIIRFNGSDLILRPNVHFQCSGLDVMHKVTRQSGGKTEVKFEQLFKGYFVTMDFNKSFQGETFVMPDEAHDIAGAVYGEALNRFGARQGTTLALMEDPAFEKHFSVYTTDPQEARYILSPKLIERINQFKTHFSQDIAFSFIGNRMYVGISCLDDMFSPPVFGPVYNATVTEKQVDMLSAIITLPELFDLDRRVWGV